MAEFKSKFSIGDNVFYAGTISTKKQHPCPDCLGKKQWSTTSPAGTEYKFSCPRCGGSYLKANVSLDYWSYEPLVQERTVGSVRMDTNNDPNRSQWSYMCKETGIGSGNIYDEEMIFSSYDEALKKSQQLAALQNSTHEHTVEQYNQSISLCDFELKESIPISVEKKWEKDFERARVTMCKMAEASTLEDAIKICDEFYY